MSDHVLSAVPWEDREEHRVYMSEVKAVITHCCEICGTMIDPPDLHVVLKIGRNYTRMDYRCVNKLRALLDGFAMFPCKQAREMFKGDVPEDFMLDHVIVVEADEDEG